MNKNQMTQQTLKAKLALASHTCRFTEQGMHYLACRVNGAKYNKPILASIELLINNSIHEIASVELQNETITAFGFKTLEPEAIIILASGRKPVYSPKYQGWQEEQSNLLDPKAPQAEILAMAKPELRKRLEEQYQLRLTQSRICATWVQLLTEQYGILFPTVKVEAKQPKSKTTAKIIPLAPPTNPRITTDESDESTVVIESIPDTDPNTPTIPAKNVTKPHGKATKPPTTTKRQRGTKANTAPSTDELTSDPHG